MTPNHSEIVVRLDILRPRSRTTAQFKLRLKLTTKSQICKRQSEPLPLLSDDIRKSPIEEDLKVIIE